MIFSVIFSLLLEQSEPSIWEIGTFFRSLGALFSIGIMRIASGFFTIAESVYSVFQALANATDIFDVASLEGIANQLYSIFGIIVLFIAVYNFLMYVVDPEKNSGDTSIEKIFKNVVKVLIIIVLLRPIFAIANGIFGSVVEGGVIETIFLGSDESKMTDLNGNPVDCDTILNYIYHNVQAAKDAVKSKTNRMSNSITTIFASFITAENRNPSDIYLVDDDVFNFPQVRCPDGAKGIPIKGGASAEDYDKKVSNIKGDDYKTCSLDFAIKATKCTGNYEYLFNFGSLWSLGYGKIGFEFFLAIISACYMIYIMISFCFDLAVRAVKLVFYQIIAPLCVACSILPGPKKDIYTKWRSLLIKTYAEVLIRILAMTLGVFFIQETSSILGNLTSSSSCDWFCNIIIRLFMILGILTFVKQIPKLISDLIGEETGLGETVRDKFKAAGGFAIAGAVGAGLVGGARGVRNTINSGKTLRNAGKDLKEKRKAMEEALKARAAYTGSHDDDEYKRLQAKAESTSAAYNAALSPRNKAIKGMLGSFAGIATGAASSAIRSASASTNGFGLDAWKKEWKDVGGNIMESAGAADSARNRRIERSENRQTHSNYVDELQTKHGMNKKEAKKEIEKLKNNIASFDATIAANANAEVDLNNAKSNYDRAVREGSHTQEELNSLKNAIAAAQSKVDAKRDAENNKERCEADLSSISGIVAKIESSENALFIRQKIEDIKNTFNSVTNPDQSAVSKALHDMKDVIESSMKSLDDTATSIVNKFGDKINVSVGSSLKKSSVLFDGKDLTPEGKVLMQALDGKNVKSIENLSNEIKACTDPEKFKTILESAGVTSGIPSDIKGIQALMSSIKTGLSSFDGAYSKEVRKQVIDECSGALPSKAIQGIIDAKITDPLLNEIKSKARIASESFQQANLPGIFETSSFGTAGARKDSMDKLINAITKLDEENAIKAARQQINKIKNPGDKK